MHGKRRTAVWMLAAALGAARGDLAEALGKLKAVGKDGAGNKEAAAAWKELAAAKPADLPKLLAAWKGLHPVAANYLHSAASAIADTAGKDLPGDALEAFLKDTAQAPEARRLAFELVVRAQPERKEPLLETLRDDPSKELRFDAVGQSLARAAGARDAGKKDQALELFAQALSAARDEKQVADAAAAIRKLGKPLDLARHFGLIQEWQLVGPFDNRGGKGWAKAYPPEKGIDVGAAYDGEYGRTEKAKWFGYATPDELGSVELNAAYKDRHKGSVTYARAEFEAKEPFAAEVRLGSIVAWKLWLNGVPLAERNESHAGYGIDQYIVPAKFAAGKNVVLLKLCQNEQTEQWAQNYNFCVRVCDANGTAILAANRPAAKPTLGPAAEEAKDDAPKAKK